MPANSPDKSGFPKDFVAFSVLLLPFLFVASEVFVSGIPDLPNAGDSALLEMSTRGVFSRGILLGPYSRFIFFHPGPLYFQLRFPIYMLLGQTSTSLIIATLVIQSVCLFLAWKIIRETLGSPPGLIFSISAVLFLLTTDKAIWLSEWNPYIIQLPFLLFTVAISAVMVSPGRLRFLLTAVISGSLAAQTHIAVIPAMTSIIALSLLCRLFPGIIQKDPREKAEWKPLLTAFGVLFVLWAAPLYQQLFPSGFEGNIGRIFSFFQESAPDVNSERALNVWASTMTDTELGGRDATLSVRLAVIGLRLLLLSGVFSLMRREGNRGFIAHLALTCIVLHFVFLLSVNQVRGELNAYLVQWMAVGSLLSVFTILCGAVIRFNLDRFRYLKYTLVALLCLGSVKTTLNVTDYFRADLHSSWENEIAVRELSRQLAVNLYRDGDDFYVLSLVTTDEWPVMFGIMNYLEKRGYPIGLEDNLLFIQTPVPEGMNPRILRIGILNEQGYAMPGLVAEYNGTGLLLQ